MEDLIKKLESVKTPEIEIQSHKQKLKMALLARHSLGIGGLNSGYFTPFRNKFLTGFNEKTIMFWTKTMKEWLRHPTWHGLVPVGVALALILVLGFTVIQPKLQIAKAMEIAKNDPQIQQLMKDYGVEIKEVKLHKGKAYVLLTLPEEKLPPLPLSGKEEIGMPGPGQFFIAYKDPKTGEIIESSGSVAEINLKSEKVEKLEMVEGMKLDIAPLTEEEKARAIEIARSDPKIKEMLPQGAEVVAVKPLPPLKLKIQTTSEKEGVRVVAYDEREDKRANVIFKSDKMQDIITVNLTTGQVEGAVSLSTESKIVPIKPIIKPERTERSLPASPPTEIKFEVGNKNLEELLKNAELIKEEAGLKVYRLPNGGILELKEADGIISIMTKAKE